MRQGEMLRFLFVTACFVAVASYSFIEKRTYRECIEGRRGQGDLFTKKDVRHCTTVAKLAADADRLALDYFIGLGDWKNGVESLSNALLRTVAPCARHSNSIKTKWTNLYEARKDHEVVIIRASEQTWNEDVGTLAFSSAVADLDLDMLEAAELLLQRSSPAGVGETFGRYHTAAFLRNANGSDERIHGGVQTSCSSTRGELMVLDLDAVSLQGAMLDDSIASLRIEVRVQARRQYIAGASSFRRTRLAVVKQAIGLVLHTRHDANRTSPHLMNALSQKTRQNNLDERMTSINLANDIPVQEDSEFQSRENTLVRNRRGLYPDRPSRSPAAPSGSAIRRKSSCGRTAHHFDRQLYTDMRIFRPAWNTEYFDIGLCEGKCSLPLTKATNHAIAVANGPQGEDLICCTPVSYHDRPLHVTIYHPSDHPNPSQVRWNQLKAQSCGCR